MKYKPTEVEAINAIAQKLNEDERRALDMLLNIAYQDGQLDALTEMTGGYNEI